MGVKETRNSIPPHRMPAGDPRDRFLIFCHVSRLCHMPLSPRSRGKYYQWVYGFFGDSFRAQKVPVNTPTDTREAIPEGTENLGYPHSREPQLAAPQSSTNSLSGGLFNSVSPLWGNSQVKGSPKNRSGTGGTSRPEGGSNEARPGTSGPPVTSCLAVPGAYVLSVEVFGARSCL